MVTATFPGRFDSLEKICEFVQQVARCASLDDPEVYAVQLAVDEACTNIIEHAYSGEEAGNIECTCDVLSDGLKVILHDHAPPFNPDEVPEPVLNVPLEEVKSRGLGLFLIRKMMDEVKFEFTPDVGNTLTMVKRKKSHARRG
jgi:serine/threonine-protein kinase RsbW